MNRHLDGCWRFTTVLQRHLIAGDLFFSFNSFRKNDDDVLVEESGTRVLIDPVSLELLRGSTIDFEDDLMRSSFVVASNPVADSSCGCGSSFVAKI
jgi:iron-sulfur cluster assembly accessory protein